MTPAEKAYVLSVIERFSAINGSGIPVSGTLKEDFEPYFEAESMVFCVKEGKGVLMGVVYPHFTNHGYLVAQELGWWVEPEYRGTTIGARLLKEFEKEVTRRGAKSIVMFSIKESMQEKVDSMYLRCGYKQLEHTFIKAV